jgi:hypothetical protein
VRCGVCFPSRRKRKYANAATQIARASASVMGLSIMACETIAESDSRRSEIAGATYRHLTARKNGAETGKPDKSDLGVPVALCQDDQLFEPAAGRVRPVSLSVGGVLVGGLLLAGTPITVRVEVLLRPEWPVTTQSSLLSGCRARCCRWERRLHLDLCGGRALAVDRRW